MPPKPTVLAFDTSAAHCAAALLSGGEITARVDEMARGQAEHLMPMLEEMLAAKGLHWSDLTALGVGIGPGNFTGIRISVSAARGLALGLGIPAVGVSGFDTRAHGLPRPVSVAIPAPRERLYIQHITHADASPPALIPVAEAPSDLVPEPAAETLITHMVQIAAHRASASTPRPAPLYVRAADAAPARDAPPVILPS
ncbi:tRNA (adenosine(37)-N6)-threonylcarbamoyltransferase complex dimerization subunit type 1 TsaB [Pelagovum sp. HNIBRBA483]|uniref:tRNA (adenosine(37)-N6)-threonylcarbamoyltransferase complex dimerization subunit type 1 TsaB n=1 Tax=Pelagovum sp. HNIBRBA483 TaxID=3233341 RepID=UPI0034A17663